VGKQGRLGEITEEDFHDAFWLNARGTLFTVQKALPLFNSIMTVTRAGGALGIPGLYVTGDPGASDADAKDGTLKVRLGLGWAKSHSFATGQCPVLKYNRGLMMSILYDKAHIADAVNATVIKLEDAPEGYAAFDSGVAQKFVLDPHGMVPAA
jgi:glutathione-independent formaldehyde dehydrogenase